MNTNTDETSRSQKAHDRHAEHRQKFKKKTTDGEKISKRTMPPNMEKFKKMLEAEPDTVGYLLVQQEAYATLIDQYCRKRMGQPADPYLPNCLTKLDAGQDILELCSHLTEKFKAEYAEK